MGNGLRSSAPLSESEKEVRYACFVRLVILYYIVFFMLYGKILECSQINHPPGIFVHVVDWQQPTFRGVIAHSYSVYTLRDTQPGCHAAESVILLDEPRIEYAPFTCFYPF